MCFLTKPYHVSSNEYSHSIVPLNGVWYLFYREQGYVPTPSYCQRVIPSFRVLVTNSTDRGVTWSTPALGLS